MSDTQNVVALSNEATQPIVSPNAAPTVCVIGCGGGGINMVRAALHAISDHATHVYIDTSIANSHPMEHVHLIEGGGSGMHRRENLEPIRKSIVTLSDDELKLADVNIVVFSMAGGSGSVIGPLLVRNILSQRNRTVIAVMIASTESKLHTDNTLATLKSMQSIVDSGQYYLPITIFTNTAGVKLVDEAMPANLARLVDLLTLPTREIDKTDRLNWLNAKKTVDVPAGLRLLHLVWDNGRVDEDTSAEVWPEAPDHVYDSVLAIRTDKYTTGTLPKARVVYSGLFASIKFTPMMGVIGNPANAISGLIHDINTKSALYKAHDGGSLALVPLDATPAERDDIII